MKSMVRSLNMFMLDYLIVPVWAVFSVLGNRNSAKIMVPITIVFIALNYLNTRNATRLFLLDVNLAAASVAGIILNTFLYIRFIYADPLIITDMVGIIFLYTLFIITACIICLALKAIMHRRNMRIISRMAYGAYDADDDEDYDEDYDEDEYEEDDEDEDDEEEEGEDGTGFLTSISNLLRSRKDEDEEEGEEEEEEPEEDEDDGYTKPDGPKFRVVKK